MRQQHQPAISDMPAAMWAGLAFVVGSLLVGVGALHQRDALWPPNHLWLWVAVAVVPIVISVLITQLPPWICIPATLAGVAMLVAHPVDQDLTPFLLVILSSLLGAAGSKAEGIAATVGGSAVMIGAEVFGSYQGSAVWVAGIGLGWMAGFYVQTSVKLLADLKAAQADLARKAAAEERERIAREIHDVVAHTLSVTMLHVTGARLTLDKDPHEAADALLEAERLGRRSLADIRRTVGLLRPDGDGMVEAPAPSGGDLPELIASYSKAGLKVRAHGYEEAAALPANVGLCLFRVVQEALSNVAKHDPTAEVEVCIERAPDLRAAVRSSNGSPVVSGAGDDMGYGIRGMRDRATTVDGTLAAGPDGDHGWLVELRVPAASLV